VLITVFITHIPAKKEKFTALQFVMDPDYKNFNTIMYEPTKTVVIQDAIKSIEKQPEGKILAKCDNESINRKFITPNETDQTITKPNRIMGCDSYRSTENEKNDRRKVNFYRAHLDDPVTYGSNYNDYSYYQHPLHLGRSLFDKYQDENMPRGVGYAFKETPAYF